MLMAMYEPGMKISSVSANLDSKEGFLMGVKARLIDYTTQKKLEMATIGPDMESVHTKKINFLRPIDKIDILSDT